MDNRFPKTLRYEIISYSGGVMSALGRLTGLELRYFKSPAFTRLVLDLVHELVKKRKRKLGYTFDEVVFLGVMLCQWAKDGCQEKPLRHIFGSALTSRGVRGSGGDYWTRRQLHRFAEDAVQEARSLKRRRLS